VIFKATCQATDTAGSDPPGLLSHLSVLNLHFRKAKYVLEDDSFWIWGAMHREVENYGVRGTERPTIIHGDLNVAAVKSRREHRCDS
jgi:hypothetical protein